jgi:hypothetical protein
MNTRHPNLIVTRLAPGSYVARSATREWMIQRNRDLGSTPWVAYADRDTVLDPIPTLSETLDVIARIELTRGATR